MQLILYFCAFYVCLAAFFYGNLRAFMLTLHPQRPSLTGSDNLLRLKPGTHTHTHRRTYAQYFGPEMYSAVGVYS